jgi:predicted Rossmann fold nucleotide-binding protein DprA/Smf involved in DNA uptake
MDALDRNTQLSPDTQATLLLCGRFGASGEAAGGTERPLSSAEYNRLAKLLLARGRRPADLVAGDAVELNGTGLGEARLRALLGRGMTMALALERWGRTGVRVLGRGDPGYPARLRLRLRAAAPHLLFVAGPLELLEAEALCVVGSRDAMEAGLEAARELGRACAQDGVAVVSGGARGIDREAMIAALEAGGRAIGILADSLIKAVLSKAYRQAILDGRLVLASASDPDARFTVASAMERNKYLYALSKAAVVVDSDVKGGTWSGAVENAEHRWVPAYVRLGAEMRPGNYRLAELGLSPLPEARQPGWVRGLLNEAPPVGTNREPDRCGRAIGAEPRAAAETDAAEELFEAFLTKIVALLERAPRSELQVADYLGIEPVQARRWLEKAVGRHLIESEWRDSQALYKVPARTLL